MLTSPSSAFSIDNLIHRESSSDLPTFNTSCTLNVVLLDSNIPPFSINVDLLLESIDDINKRITQAANEPVGYQLRTENFNMSQRPAHDYLGRYGYNPGEIYMMEATRLLDSDLSKVVVPQDVQHCPADLFDAIVQQDASPTCLMFRWSRYKPVRTAKAQVARCYRVSPLMLSLVDSRTGVEIPDAGDVTFASLIDPAQTPQLRVILKTKIKDADRQHFVVDTNVFIQHLTAVRAIVETVNLAETQSVLVVPIQVLAELENKKTYPAAIGFASREAIRYLDSVKQNVRFQLDTEQPHTAPNSQINRTADDKIIQCAQYYMDNVANHVILLAQDNALRLRATSLGVQCLRVEQLDTIMGWSTYYQDFVQQQKNTPRTTSYFAHPVPQAHTRGRGGRGRGRGRGRGMANRH